MTIKCVAIDDEYLALDVIKNYVQKIPFLELVKTFDNGLPFITYVREHRVDLLFLDIQMKELTGIQLLKSLSNPPLIIFTTAYDAYAVESYELDILDYLLKPISFERFVKSVDKAYNKLIPSKTVKNNIENIAIGNSSEDFFFVKSGTSLERIAYKDILYIKGERDYLKIVMQEKSILVLLKFKYFEGLLPSNNFFRVHKSYMVSIDKIKKIDSNLIYISDIKIPMGSSYKTAFLAAINNHQ